MASKVLVKLPTVPTVHFPQGKKPPSDLVAQLEQNMKFLQEQHQATLVALHQEVDFLRQKNRDLQFQLVFSKGSAYVPSTPSSPEDNGTGFVKSKGSPVCVNIAPLQVELLEKDLQDIKISLQEAKTQNQYLSEIVEQQKKKLNSSEEQKTNKQLATDIGIQNADQRKEIETLEAASADTANPVQADLVTRLEVADAAAKLLLKQNEYQRKEIATLKATSTNTANPVQADLVTRLEVADAAVKLLLRQNEYQRKEIATLKGTSANTTNVNKGARYRDSNNSHHSRGSPTSSTQEQIPHKFPPLQTQSYWYRRILRNGRNRHDKQDHQTEVDSTVLPQLQNVKIEKINRKYGLKDRRNGDNNHQNHHHNHHHHRRDYKDRNSRDHQKEIADSAEGSREADNSAGNKS